MLISCKRKGPSRSCEQKNDGQLWSWKREKWWRETGVEIRDTPEVDVSKEQGGRWCSWVEYCSRPHAHKGRGHSEKQGPWLKDHSGRPGPSISSSVKNIPQPQGCCMDSTVNYNCLEPKALLETSWCKYGEEVCMQASSNLPLCRVQAWKQLPGETQRGLH